MISYNNIKFSFIHNIQMQKSNDAICIETQIEHGQSMGHMIIC